MARVLELNYFPIKGCAGVSVPDALVNPAGLSYDRSFMVVSPEGVFRSQRRDPRLALVCPQVLGGGEVLRLSAEGFESVDVVVDAVGPRRPVEMFGDPYRAIDQGEVAAAWLSAVVGDPCRLVRVPPEHDRATDGLTPGTSGFADSSAVHLLSVDSLAGLNERMVAAGAVALPMARFRPNIVVDGWADPHAEDGLRRLRIGDVELGYTKLAIRCAVTTVDQESGVKRGPEPLRSLAKYRRAAQGGVAFGVKFAVLRSGKLSVGDELSVLEWGASEL
ncbi:MULTISPECIES: MOSC N-terminal beta barrel domain-containing protein [unclassified Crossiella]|uniref:MOSC domain-containing protein n=1 Tax=unclassified Crossiella TaxID=2620835 RepID=UPI001FFFCC62|nr:MULTISPECIES: MOSC N-terminal beta barrel domain-containing protein [unclassified Crossiella]MCK2238778.1 MOSC domain-containing protein [Crossiella sp. S99.2]MCK2251652.1 MOSC domain-containing protein [Crossiella sp. S99.1]